MLNGLDLFSGIGGIGIALNPWVRTLAYCEQDRYAQGVLLSRMRSGDIDLAGVWDDVRSLRAEHFGIPIDIIFGGFPCQDISTAGHGAGLGGERSGLFFEIIRLTRELRPRFVFLENVPAISIRGLDRVLLEFNALGYDCRWTTVSAEEVGAPHLRERWFLLAHTNGVWEPQLPEGRDHKGNGSINGCEKVADAGGERFTSKTKDGKLDRLRLMFTGSGDRGTRAHWEVEPNVGRVVDELPFRMDRIRCLGNSVVPAQVREAFKRLLTGGGY